MPDRARPRAGGRRSALVAVLLVGVGLALAPAAFQMFERAPKGGDMIEDFEPYMSSARIDRFSGFLDQIGAAEAEVGREVAASPAGRPAVHALHERWPTIDADMRDMLGTMRRNLGRFDGVRALPPFALFPWFFVVPGVLLAGIAAWALWRSGSPGPGARRALVVIGIGLVAAPFAFQMFTRAPGGGRMIDDFRSMMTTERVTTVQGYFLVLGAAEGELRTDVLPAVTAGDDAAALPAVRSFVADWPRIANEMAPMIGTMADNLDSFAAVDALPPFALFPWFFVVPGVLVVGLAWWAGRAPVVDRVHHVRGSEGPAPGGRAGRSVEAGAVERSPV